MKIEKTNGGVFEEDPKTHIVKLNLGFVSRYVPIPEAHALTFGGDGVEARQWQKEGVGPKNGWLVERDRIKGGKLVRGFSYRSHNELRTLPQVLVGLYGEEKAFIDYAHVDLCGTLTEEAIADFTPILPLVFKSRGKCLAVTVADSRRNLALEHWPDFVVRGRKLFGSKSRPIYDALLDVSRRLPTNSDIPEHFTKFDPENGAKREFGLLVELAEILQDFDFAHLPVRAERFIYVSRYCGKPFRMRTYLFRFEAKKLARPARALARVWLKSRLSFANSEGFQEIQQAVVRKTPERQKTKGEKMPSKEPHGEAKPSKLASIVRLIGGDVEIEYSDLMSKAQAGKNIVEALARAGIQFDAPMTAVPATAQPAKRRRGRPVGSTNRKTIESFDAKELIKLRLDALELRAASNGDWIQKKKGFLKERFGHCNPSLSRRIGGLVARTSGEYRPEFKELIVSTFGDEESRPLIERLDKLPLKFHE